MYTISIENLSQEKVQRLRRTWIIYDGVYGRREIKGQGVVGKKSVIDPGQVYEYLK